MQVSPLKQTTSGARPLHVSVLNVGTKNLTVRVSVLTLHSKGNGCAFSASNPGIKVTPSTFTLASHAKKVTTVRVAKGIPQGDYAVVYSGLGSGNGTSHVAGAIGSQVLTTGASSCVHQRPVAAVTHTGGINPLFPIIAAAVALVALAVAFTYSVRRNRNRKPFIAGAHRR